MLYIATWTGSPMLRSPDQRPIAKIFGKTLLGEYTSMIWNS